MIAPLACLLVVSCPPCAAQPLSLLEGGAFEGRSLDLTLGPHATIDSTVARSGKRSLKLAVPAPAGGPVTSGSASWTIQDFEVGATYTISAWAKTDNVVPNEGKKGYAYLAVYQYDRFGDYVAYWDFTQPTGTAGWTRYTYTFTIGADTRRLLIPVGLFQASGTLWVDDFTLVKGEQPMDIDEVASPASVSGATGKPAIAILRDDLPVVGAGSDPVYLKQILDDFPGQPYDVHLISAAQLADRKFLSPLRFNTVILPYGATFPVPAADAFRRFLRGGGNMITMGGYAFNNLVGGEKPKDEPPPPEESSWQYRIPVTPEMRGKPLTFRGNLRCRSVTGGGFAYLAVYQWGANWKLGTWRDTLHVTGDHEWTPNTYSFRVDDDAETIEVKAGLFRCTGTASFDDLSVVDEAGQELVNDPGFESVADPDDKRPHHWFRTQKDLASTTASNALSGEQCAKAWLDASWVGELVMNTARGTPADGLQVAPEQIGVFDAGFPLKRAFYAKAAPDQFVVPQSFLADAPMTGWAATTVQGYDEARRIPLLNAVDRFGRLRGSVASLTYRYGGHYARSAWAIFGAEDFDFFPEGAPAGPELLAPVVEALVNETFLHNLTTDYATYRQGEAVRISVKVSNFGAQAQAVKVRLTLTPSPSTTGRAEGLTGGRGEATGRSIELPPLEATVEPDATVELSAEWKPDRFEASFYQLDAGLQLGDRRWDRMSTGFCVWDEKLVKSGPDCTLKDNLFRLDGREHFLQGTDTFSFTFYSAHENPLIWRRDFATMRDQGMNLPENLQVGATGMETPYVWPEWLLRKTDAMVQLAQEYGQVYMPGLLIGCNVAVEDDVLEKEASWAQAFVKRYKDVPGILWYINGDFQLNLGPVIALAEQRGGEVPRTDVERLWNDFLKQRYASDEALTGAWTEARVPGPLGKVPFQDYQADGWDDVRAMDLARFKVELMRRWINRHVRAIREVDTHHAITSEYYRLPMPGIDIVWAAGDHDCANIGYFDHPQEDIARFPASLRFADLRARGKSMSAGEFGCKTHPAWGDGKDHDYHITRTEAQQEQLWLAITHYGWGLGASKVHNWDWKDNVEAIFPWGMVYPGDWVKKDCLDVYRASGLLFRQFEREYRAPEVYVLTPDTHRLGAPVNRVFEATLSAFQTLQSLGVDMGTLNECALDRIPDSARLIFYPVPYQIPDEVYARLKEWVAQGGTLYVSGDVSYDALRRRTLTDRLKDLCGVRFVAERFPDIRMTKDTQLAAEFGGQELPANPALRVEADGAQVLFSAKDGTPVLTRWRVGGGRVFYSAWPLELDDVYAAATVERNQVVYGHVLREAAAFPKVAEQAGRCALPVTVPLTGAASHAEVYVNPTDEMQRAAAGQQGAGVKLAPNAAGLAVWGDNGSVLALETADRAHHAVYALDRQDITRSKRLCLLPLAEGDVHLRTEAAWRQPVAVVGEVIDGHWVEYETLALQPGPGRLTVPIDGDRRLAIILVAEKDEAETCARAVVRSLTQPSRPR